MIFWQETAPRPPRLSSLAPTSGSFETFLAAASLLELPASRGRALLLGLGSLDETRGVAHRFVQVVGIDPDALAVQRARRDAGAGGRHSFLVGDDPDPACGAFDLILCDFRRIPAGRRPLRRIGSLLRLLAPGGVALFDVPRRGLRSWLTVPSAGSTVLAWPDLAREAAEASARIAWVDKGRREGTIYCVVRNP